MIILGKYVGTYRDQPQFRLTKGNVTCLHFIRYVEFDFHRECRGMKYENISNLIVQLENKFSAMG